MRDQFDNYEKRIMEKLDREAEEIERRIGEDPQAAKAVADDELDRKVYARVKAYENAVAARNGSGMDGEVCAEETEDGRPAGLSDEDWEAMRLGRELQRRRREEESRKEAREKTRKFVGRWKHIVAAVAVLVLVAGLGVNSIGGPNRVVEIIELVIGGREISKVNSSTDDVKLTTEQKEMEVYQQIKDELGIDPVRIFGLPDGTIFKKYEVDSEIRLAQLVYLFEERSITYLISDSYTEELWSVDFEDDILEEYSYINGKLDAEIIEYELPDSKVKRYVAQFEYKGVYYQLTGTMEWDKFEEILKNLHFPV